MQNHYKKTKQDSYIVRFDRDSDASTSCGGCEEERGEELVGSENGPDAEQFNSKRTVV